MALGLGCAAIASAGWARHSENRHAWTASDSWYTEYPLGEEPYWSWSEIERSRIHEVVEARQLAAEELLERVPILAIHPGQAAGLIGGQLSDAPGTEPYLTRGVYLIRETGSFSVHTAGTQLMVHHGCLGRSQQRVARQTLVLQLESAPSEVFAACSMAD